MICFGALFANEMIFIGKSLVQGLNHGSIIMPTTARLYYCLNCNCQNIICSRCDRGNRYCKQCAPIIKAENQKKANQRYQRTYQGKINHAARQKRYRERLKQKVTYQGSKRTSLRDLLNKKRKGVIINFESDKKRKPQDIFCHCCDENCSTPLRDDYLTDLNRNNKRRGRYKDIFNKFLRPT